MKHVFLITATIFLQASSAQAGWLDSLKSKAQGVVDNTINEATGQVEQAVENKVSGEAKPPTQAPSSDPPYGSSASPYKKTMQSSEKVDSDTLANLYNGNTTPWNVAPADSLKAIDTEIKGVRLGMPEILIDDILKAQGFERTGIDTFEKEAVLVNGKTRELTRSEFRAQPSEVRAKGIAKRYFITYYTVVPSEEFLENLDEPLKSLVDKARVKMKEVRQAQEQRQAAPRNVRRWQSSASLTSTPVDFKKLHLICHLEYRQAYIHGTKFDREVLKAQYIDHYGKPNYNFPELARKGSAFDTGADWLIYHDAALVPVKEKDALLSKMPRKYRHAFKSAFIHPCGGKDTRNCLGAPVSGAFPDDLALQLAAARITLAPVMMVQVRNPNVRTILGWQYLATERTIRENYNKEKAFEAQPNATAEF